MALTRMLKGPSSRARFWVRLKTAALDTAYGSRIGRPTTALIDDTLTIEPNFCVFINGIARRHKENGR